MLPDTFGRVFLREEMLLRREVNLPKRSGIFRLWLSAIFCKSAGALRLTFTTRKLQTKDFQTNKRIED